MTQKGLLLDAARCSGCMACVVACLEEKDAPAAAPPFLRQVVRLERGVYPHVSLRFLSLSCMHCNQPPCRAACPCGAIGKRAGDGIVTVDETACIGCHSCAGACPFGAVHFSLQGKMMKCDLCLARVQEGLEPACARACPTRALQWGPLEALAQKRASKAAQGLGAMGRGQERVVLASLCLPE